MRHPICPTHRGLRTRESNSSSRSPSGPPRSPKLWAMRRILRTALKPPPLTATFGGCCESVGPIPKRMGVQGSHGITRKDRHRLRSKKIGGFKAPTACRILMPHIPCRMPQPATSCRTPTMPHVPCRIPHAIHPIPDAAHPHRMPHVPMARAAIPCPMFHITPHAPLQWALFLFSGRPHQTTQDHRQGKTQAISQSRQNRSRPPTHPQPENAHSRKNTPTPPQTDCCAPHQLRA